MNENLQGVKATGHPETHFFFIWFWDPRYVAGFPVVLRYHLPS